jgi:non-ribosomal peptide synthetase component F
LDNGIQESLNFWTHQLNGAPDALDLATDRPRPTQRSYAGGEVAMSLSSALSSDLRSFATQEGVSIYVLLLSITYSLLYRYTGQEDIVVGSVVANRANTDLLRTVGMFVNTIATRAHVSSDMQFIDLLSQVRAFVQRMVRHQSLPLDRLVEHLHIKREFGRNPLFEIMFVHQGFGIPSSALNFVGTSCEPFAVHETTAQFDLTFITTEKSIDTPSGCIELRINYNADIFDKETIQYMASSFEALAESVSRITSPQECIGELNILMPDDADTLLRQSQGELSCIAEDATVLSAFT